MSRTSFGSLIATALLFIAGSPAMAVDKEQVKRSVDAAVAFLKASVTREGDPFGGAGGGGGGPGIPGVAGVGAGGGAGAGSYMEGPKALAGIALIEAGVPTSDPAIISIAKTIREAAITQGNTYQLALDILFLDKLGEEIDTVLIQSMGARLLLGQNAYGGWAYSCATLDEREQARLRGKLAGATLKGSKEAPQVGMDPDRRPGLDEGAADILQGKRVTMEPIQGSGDNSNTQFAIIAMWAARRHGVPVDKAMKLIEARFRATQHQQLGCWPYTISDYSAPMTCSGLLGLAIASGFKSERSMRSKGTIGADGKLDVGASKDAKRGPNPLNDEQVKKALAFLAAVINTNRSAIPQGGPMGGRGPAGFGPGAPGGPPGAPKGPGGPGGFGGPPGGGGPGVPPPPPGAPGAPPGVGGLGGGFGPMGGHGGDGDVRKDLYFLWSLERVCMVFNLNTIGGKDWHAWGAEYLLATQRDDGSWRGKYNGQIDTSFALMFMIRSNIVRDLSRIMKGGGGDFNPTAAAGGKPGDKPGDKPAPPPVKAVDTESAPLTKALVEAGAAKQSALIKEYMEAKGGKYSRALADAIPKLKGDAQTEARDALAQRMARMSAKSLEGYLDDDHVEIRRAAALGAAMRDEKDLIPVLIDCLDDEAELVWRAARVALRELTGKDFGPKPGDNDAKRAKAVAEWRDWLKTKK